MLHQALDQGAGLTDLLLDEVSVGLVHQAALAVQGVHLALVVGGDAEPAR